MSRGILVQRIDDVREALFRANYLVIGHSLVSTGGTDKRKIWKRTFPAGRPTTSRPDHKEPSANDPSAEQTSVTTSFG